MENMQPTPPLSACYCWHLAVRVGIVLSCVNVCSYGDFCHCSACTLLLFRQLATRTAHLVSHHQGVAVLWESGGETLCQAATTGGQGGVPRHCHHVSTVRDVGVKHR